MNSDTEMIMNINAIDDDVKKIEYPFTQLFFLLTKYKTQADAALRLAYSPENLHMMQQCVNDLVASLSRGLKFVGDLLAATDIERAGKASVSDIGAFISTTCNLIDVLNGFGSDACNELRQRGMVDF